MVPAGNTAPIGSGDVYAFPSAPVTFRVPGGEVKAVVIPVDLSTSSDLSFGPRCSPPEKDAMELTASEAWARILERARPLLPDQTFRTWLERTEPIALSPEALAVSTQDEFAAEWIEDKYGRLLGDVAEGLFGRRLNISFRPQSTGETAERTYGVPAPLAEPAARPVVTLPATASQAAGGAPTSGAVVGSPLNERYSFERFVVGSNNQLAAAACRAVAEAPGRMYNPLFIYGGVGLGKTHLMHAIGNAILGRDGSKRTAYVSSERFTNDLIGSIQEGRMAEFRRRYRGIDLLLIDDVHFLSEKERTQEEFFHTFNALHDAQRQIVLTSDRPPQEIAGLEERLVSRFAWGLVADIKPPDFETRVAILRKKAEDDQIALADEVLDFIARNCRSNVRELEGAVIKLLAYSSLTRREITTDLTREALASVLDAAARRTELTAAFIRERIAESFSVSVEALCSKKRTKDLTVPRQIAMFLIRELLDVPLVEIGRLFGGRDHSTVIHAINKVQEDVAADAVFGARLQALRADLTN
jgi:chromosomal replication initiator protein